VPQGALHLVEEKALAQTQKRLRICGAERHMFSPKRKI